MRDNLTLTAPETIYLCVSDDPYDHENALSFPENHEAVSWYAGKPVNQTVEYVRADLVPTWKDAPDAPGWWFYRLPDTTSVTIHTWYVCSESIKNRKYNLPLGGMWLGPISEMTL